MSGGRAARVARLRAPLLSGAALAVAGALALAAALAGSSYTVPSSVVSGGGGTSSGGSYALTAAIGQAVVGTSSGGAYRLTAGFPPGSLGGPLLRRIYLPVIAKGVAP